MERGPTTVGPSATRGGQAPCPKPRQGRQQCIASAAPAGAIGSFHHHSTGSASMAATSPPRRFTRGYSLSAPSGRRPVSNPALAHAARRPIGLAKHEQTLRNPKSPQPQLFDSPGVAEQPQSQPASPPGRYRVRPPQRGGESLGRYRDSSPARAAGGSGSEARGGRSRTTAEPAGIPTRPLPRPTSPKGRWKRWAETERRPPEGGTTNSHGNEPRFSAETIRDRLLQERE